MTHYVRFVRGTPKAFENLAKKDEDTLYFICEKDELDGSLYLGSKKIAGEGDLEEASIDALADVLLSENIDANSILVYDDIAKQWVNKKLEDIFQPFVGATTESSGVMGLVPAPEQGETKLFLRSDGIWALPASEGEGSGYITSVSSSFSVTEDGELQLNKVPISNVEGLEDAMVYKGTISQPSDLPTEEVRRGWTYMVAVNILKEAFADIKVNWATVGEQPKDDLYVRIGDLLVASGESEVLWVHIPSGYNADYAPLLSASGENADVVEVKLTSPHADANETGDLGILRFSAKEESNISVELNDNQISFGLYWKEI